MIEGLIGVNPVVFITFAALFIAFGAIIGTLATHAGDSREERQLEKKCCPGCFLITPYKPYMCRGCPKGKKFADAKNAEPITKRALREHEQSQELSFWRTIETKEEPKEQE